MKLTADEIRGLVDHIKRTLDLMSDEQRKHVLDQLAEVYCTHCGGRQPKRPPMCQCWNDE